MIYPFTSQWFRLCFLLALSCVSLVHANDDKSLLVYSARKSQLIDHVFKAYEEKTGIKVNYVTDKAAPLLQKIQAQGLNCPADLLLTVDAGNLWAAKEAGILSNVSSRVLESSIPPAYRDADGAWFGLSVRARTIVYNSDKVNPSELSSYEDLASPKWKGKLVLRTSKKVYNQSMVAMMLNRHGHDKTLEVVKGWVNNLAAPVYMKDSLALKSIAAGQGSVTLVNTYYYGRLMEEQPDLPLKVFWPNQGSTGVHVNLSGAGVIKSSKKKDQAVAFLEWLSSAEAQAMFAEVNMEYPANQNVPMGGMAASWGDFKADKTHLSVAGSHQRKAIMLMDLAKYK